VRVARRFQGGPGHGGRPGTFLLCSQCISEGVTGARKKDCRNYSEQSCFIASFIQITRQEKTEYYIANEENKHQVDDKQNRKRKSDLFCFGEVKKFQKQRQ
jgi:hypothetical protein